jgi:hypothetical protein
MTTEKGLLVVLRSTTLEGVMFNKYNIYIRIYHIIVQMMLIILSH